MLETTSTSSNVSKHFLYICLERPASILMMTTLLCWYSRFDQEAVVLKHLSSIVSDLMTSPIWQILGNKRPLYLLNAFHFKIPEMKDHCSNSKSKSCYDRQSVCMSWCQVHSGTRDQMLHSVWKLLCFLCGAPSLMRSRVCLLSFTFISV
jgi:hypothetical protein